MRWRGVSCWYVGIAPDIDEATCVAIIVDISNGNMEHD
jgi:hypothetical protein